MSLSPLVPLVTAVSVTMLLPILNAGGARRAHLRSLRGLYRFPKGLRAFLWAGSALWVAAPFCFVLFDIHLTTGDWVGGAIVDVFLILCGMYADRYAVEICEDSIRYGAFLKKEVMFDRIVSMDLRTSNSGTRYCILKFSTGGVFKIDGNLQDFDDLVSELSARFKCGT